MSETLMIQVCVTLGTREEAFLGLIVRVKKYAVGKITLRTKLDDGLELTRVTCPIGVLLIIFEARPEVIANIASLAVKSGNAAILKGNMKYLGSLVIIS